MTTFSLINKIVFIITTFFGHLDSSSLKVHENSQFIVNQIEVLDSNGIKNDSDLNEH